MTRALILAALLVVALTLEAPAEEYPITITRAIDADTFDAEVEIPVTLADLTFVVRYPIRIRLACINAPESRGSRKSPEGVAMAETVKGWGLERGTAELLKRDAFGRFIAHVRPAGWDATLNQALHAMGAPLYGRLTRAERFECVARL